MTRRPMTGSIAGLALATALLGAAPCRAADPATTFDLLWVAPPEGPAVCTRLLLVEAPRDWMAGDAVAVLIADDAEDGLAAQVTEALLAQEAAVLHLHPGRTGGVGDCSAAPPGPVVELLGALGALRRQAGAGLVVAIGLGALGPAALDAAEEATAARILGPGGPRLAAAMAVGGQGPASFRAGTSPPAAERWEARAPHLCAVLAPLGGPGAAEACLDSLTQQGPDLASLRPPR